MEYKKLGDIASYINGYAFKPKDRGGEGLPIIRIQDLTGNSYDLGFYNGDYPEKIEINDGDVLISWSASLGVYVWNRGKALLNQHIFKVAFDKIDINKSYFVYAVRRKLDEMASKTHGATMKHIVKKDFDTTQIPYPSLEEQAEIAANLDRVSRIIESRKEELDKLDELIKARFVELFGRLEDNKYPSARLGDYAKLQGGFAFKSKDFVADGIPLVQIGNVNKDYLDWNVVNAVPEDYLDKYREFSLMKDDLVMAMTRPIIKSLGSVKVAKVAETDLPCLLNQRVGRFQINDKLHPVFLEALCKTDDFKDYVERMSGNSLQPNISSKQVEDYNIIIPPEALQEQFAKFVKQVDKSKVAVQKALDEAQLLFDSLMQDYFG